ncbi:MAG: methionyl-tRNA formyltransferase [Candidatus Aureabacteria bacterium]|nr:methionyl-tRNA formyltransferase [Candidatus Auribacterota bacterium]
MKIIFMGTPEFAVPSLEAFAQSDQELVAVVTREDMPQGRRLILSPPPVKQRALQLGLRVIQPAKLNDEAFIREVRQLAPDLVAVVAYGAFLPKSLYELPPLGTINLHPSLLPKYRGAAPIQRAILNGESETGVTIISLSEEMDAGDIILQERVPIEPTDTSESLGEKLSLRGAHTLLAAVKAIEKGTEKRVPQDGTEATFAPKIRKEDGLIDWRLSAPELARRVRAFSPWPGTYTYLASGGGGMFLKVRGADSSPPAGEAGMIIRCDSQGIHVGTGNGTLILREVQPEGKKAMTAAQFAAGHRDLVGKKLGGEGEGSSKR